MNFKEDINGLKQIRKQLSFVNEFLEAHSDAELYLVGGAVRDLVMGQNQSTSVHVDVDFDFVVRGLEPKVLEKWFSTRGEINLVGKTFGVFRFMPKGMDTPRTPYIDIALPRTEQAHAQTKGGYREFNVQSDANLPIEEDLARRDFTINAMAINMRTGELVDPYNGQEDIRRRTIRAVGDPNERFNEDLSRMLRAIRFASELHFEMEEKTLKAIRKNIGRIDEAHGEPPQYIVPRETIGSELAKALARNPAGAARWLLETGAMSVLFGETSDISNLKEGNPTLAVALLLRTHDRARITSLLTKTGLDSLPRGTLLRIEPSDVLWLLDRLAESWDEHTVMKLRASTFEKYFMNGRGALFQQALEAIGEDTTLKSARDRARAIRDRWSVEEGEPIPPLISGNDVIEAGIPAGPKVRETLEILRDQQLEGKILTREQAKRWLKDKSSSDGVKE